MMVEKESGTLRDPDFPSIWTEDTTGGTGTQRYVIYSVRLVLVTSANGLPRFLNTITGSRVYRKPKLCLGGLIADVSDQESRKSRHCYFVLMLFPQDMGLGKTLTALALIAGSATTPSNKSATRAATLVIAPLSSMYLDSQLKYTRFPQY